jgi:hypothetical protein
VKMTRWSSRVVDPQPIRPGPYTTPWDSNCVTALSEPLGGQVNVGVESIRRRPGGVSSTMPKALVGALAGFHRERRPEIRNAGSDCAHERRRPPGR